jgi:hypothetical protein
MLGGIAGAGNGKRPWLGSIVQRIDEGTRSGFGARAPGSPTCRHAIGTGHKSRLVNVQRGGYKASGKNERNKMVFHLRVILSERRA